MIGAIYKTVQWANYYSKMLSVDVEAGAAGAGAAAASPQDPA